MLSAFALAQLPGWKDRKGYDFGQRFSNALTL
jgi:hypothetical protein